jgi:putative ABC transport system permease protein
MITLLLVAIASTAFIAAGLGTLNIMMISVLERVREIGIFKALGMKDKEVLSIYIIQGLIVGFLGVLVGLGAGTALAYALPAALQSFGAGMTSTGGGVGGGFGGMGAFGGSGGFSMSFTPLISFYYVGIASATSLIVTLLSTAYPAWRASKLRPVEALKYE